MTDPTASARTLVAGYDGSAGAAAAVRHLLDVTDCPVTVILTGA